MTKPGQKIKADPTALAGIEDRQYTVKEVADLFEVGVNSVRHWIRSGQLQATQASRKNGYQVPRESLVKFAVRRYQS